MERVEHYLASKVWTRHVSDSGGTSIGNHLYSLGRTYAGHAVAVTYRPEAHAFRFELPDGSLAAQLPARQPTQADLIGFVPLTGLLAEPFQLPLPLEGI